MKLKCNVCIVSPIVEVTNPPSMATDELLCPVCSKCMAVTVATKRSLSWKPINTDPDRVSGITPITIIEP